MIDKSESELYRIVQELTRCKTMYDFMNFRIKYKMKRNFISRLLYHREIKDMRKKNYIDDTEMDKLKQSISDYRTQNLNPYHVHISDRLINFWKKQALG